MLKFIINQKLYIINVKFLILYLNLASEQLENTIEPYIHTLKDDDNACYTNMNGDPKFSKGLSKNKKVKK